MTTEIETPSNPVSPPVPPPKKSGWRWVKRVLWIPVVLLLLLVLALGWIIGTDTGTRWSLDTAQQHVSALTIESPSGSFWRGISADTIAWQQDDTSILITELDTQWRLGCLLELLVCIDKIAVTSIDVQLPASDDEPSPDESDEPVTLPTIKLPIDIDLTRLTIDSININLGEAQEPLNIEAIEFSASTRDNNVTLSTLSLAYQQYRAALSGSISLSDDYPINLTLAASATPLVDQHNQNLNLRFSGSLENLVIDGDTSGLADLTLTATLQPLDQTLPYSAKINWDEITWPPKALPSQVISQAGEITAKGNLQGYAITINNSVQGDGIPGSKIRLEGEGDFTQFELASLLIETLGGQIDINGNVDWQEDISWAATLKFDKLDPSLQWPDLSGDLSGGFATQGRVKGDAISATLDDVEVDGRVLDYPLSLRASAEHAIDQTILLKSLMLEIDENTGGVPKTRLTISGQGDYSQFNASSIKVETLDGEVNGETRVIWSDPAFPGRLQWLTDLVLSNINPGNQWPDFPGQLNGKLTADGAAEGDSWALNVSQGDITGQIRNYPLTLNTNLNRGTNGQLTVDRLILNSGNNQIQVAGSLSDEWALDGDLRISQAEALLPTLSGTAEGNFAIRGAPDAPDIALNLNAQSLAINDVSIEAVEVEATVAALGESNSDLKVTATGIKTSAVAFSDVEATLSGSRTDHQLTLSTEGDIDVSAKLEGALDDAMNWLGALASADIEAYEQAWSLQKPAPIGWQNETQTIDIAAHCWAQDDARFCLDEDASIAESGKLKFSMVDFSLKSLQAYFPAYSEFEGIVTVDGDLKWQADQQPQANINLAVSDGGIILLADDENEPLDLRYQRLSVDIVADEKNVTAALRLDSENMGNASANINIDPTTKNRPISGTVSLEQLELATFKAFFPQLKVLNGSFTAMGDISGDLTAPIYQGNADITDLNVAANDLPVTINDGFIRTKIYGTRADIDAGWLSGGALVTLIGDADWKDLDVPVINLKLEGESIEVRQAPTVIARVSPNIKLSINGQDIKINGRVDIPYARVTIQELPEEATQISKDVVVIVEETAPPEAEKKLRISTRVIVSLGKDVRFEGFGLRASLIGDIGIKQEPGQILLLDGEVQIPDGIYKAYGQNLTIQRGRLLFVGPIDETAVEVDAVRVVDLVTAGLRVRGSIKSPKVTLFSSPQQTQENTLSYIVLGKPIGARSGSEAGILAQAALALSIEGGRDIATSIAEQFGIEDFQIDTVGSGDESQVQLSGRLSPNLLLSYGVGVLTPVNTLKLRYNLTESFYVETTQSVESALDFFYTFDI